eukprot:4485321-Prymnesium_polylepis.3
MVTHIRAGELCYVHRELVRIASPNPRICRESFANRKANRVEDLSRICRESARTCANSSH